MSKWAIYFGGVLVLLGFGALKVAGTDGAIIPTLVGIFLILAGIIGRKENLKKHALHASAFVSLIGFAANVGALFSITSSPASTIKGITALLCVAFFLLCAKSYLDARAAKSSSDQ